MILSNTEKNLEYGMTYPLKMRSQHLLLFKQMFIKTSLFQLEHL